MVDPYRMIVINIIFSFLLFCGIIIFRYVYPKKKINLLFLLLLISLLPLISMLRSGTYESGDLSLHSLRASWYFDILINDHVLPRWTPQFNVGYGDPHFLFSYLFHYFTVSLLHLTGLSFISSTKMLLALSFIISGVAMYWWVKSELGEKAGFTSGIFYMFSPYHLVDMHFRVTVGETISFAFLPIILLAIKKLTHTHRMRYFSLLTISIALLILTHQVITLSFLPLAIFYGIFEWYRKSERKISHLFYFFLSIALGILLTSFYWLPIIAEAKYTKISTYSLQIQFPDFFGLFYSPFRHGFLFQGPKGELSYLLGYTQWFVVFSILYLLIRKRSGKSLTRLALLFISILFIYFFFITSFSKPLWYTLKIFNFFQLSSRLLVPAILCVSLLSGILVKKINRHFFFVVLCTLTIVYTMLNWGNRRTIPQINDGYLKRENEAGPDKSGLEPSAPIWANIEKTSIRSRPKSHVEVINGDAFVKQISRKSNRHEYIVNAKYDTYLKENTLYFPGWTLFVDNKKHSLNYQTKNYPGIITFHLTKGVYKVELIFLDTPIRKYAKLISLLTLFSLIIGLVIQMKKIKLRKYLFIPSGR